MTFTAWRIVKRKHSNSAFDGVGARKYGGRWNSAGVAVAYTSESQSLAALEMLVHLDRPSILHSYVFIAVEISTEFVISVDIAKLPGSWRSYPAPLELQSIGDDWVRSGDSAVLQVPSALLPSENNFLLNPKHADAKKLIFGDPVPFEFDSRLNR